MVQAQVKGSPITSKSVKNFLSNNAIIILIVLLALVVGISTDNFFSVNNFRNLVVNVSPRFIIACGVSGAMQHVSGIMGSKYIVAINKDEAASIFDIADVGIVGDVKEILPLLIEEIKNRK